MSFGQGPFGVAVLGIAEAALAAAPQTALSSSRKIDGVTRRYVLTADGGFEPERDISQRIQLLLDFGMPAEPQFLDDRFAATIDQRVRAALAPLTDGPEPSIAIVSIAVTPSGPTGTRREVVVRDLVTNDLHTADAAI